MKKLLVCMAVFILALAFSPLAQAESPNVSHLKKWTITFNKAVDPKSVSTKTIYVVNDLSPNSPVPVTYEYSADNKKVTVTPVTPYITSANYRLHVTNGVKDTKGKALKAAKTVPFTIENVCGDYNFEQTKSTKVVQITTTETQLGACTPYHDQKDNLKFNTKHTYSSSTDNYFYEYAGETDAYYFVMVAGQKMYVDKQDAKLVTLPADEQIAYYEKKGSNLIVSVYRGENVKREDITLFEAPDFMQQGVSYTSPDGANFYDADGKRVGTAYNYFQHVSLRVPTNYTATELDAYLQTKLAPESALHGIGETLIAAQEKYGINALFLLAFAINESDWGKSNHAMKNNNLFGFKIYDINPDTTIYPSIEQNLDIMLNYIDKIYLTAMQDYSRGATIGSNAHGLNARYSTDPYWGLKIAALMDQLDKSLGNKDKFTQKIGVIDSEFNYSNIRPIASNSLASIYTHTPGNGRGITIIGEQNGYYEIINDYSRKQSSVFISKTTSTTVDTY